MDLPDVHYAKTSDGVYIAYAVLGEGPFDIVSELDLATYIDFELDDPLMRPWYQELASFSRVVLLDRRGIGLSSRHVPPHNLETRVADVRTVVDDVGCRRPVLLGAFEACASSALLAATDPDGVQAMVWVEPVARSLWTPDYPWGYDRADVEEELRSLEVWGTLEYGKRFVEHQAARNNDFGPEAAVLMAKYSRNLCAPDVALELTKIWYETDIRGVLPAVQAPTLLLLHGGRQNTLEESQYIASQMPSATIKGMPGDCLVRWRDGVVGE